MSSTTSMDETKENFTVRDSWRYRLYIGNGNWVNLSQETTQDLLEIYRNGVATKYEITPGLYLDIIPNDVDCNSKNTDLTRLMRADLCYENNPNDTRAAQQALSLYVKNLLEEQGIIDAFPPLRKPNELLPAVSALPSHRHLSMVPAPQSITRRTNRGGRDRDDSTMNFNMQQPTLTSSSSTESLSTPQRHKVKSSGGGGGGKMQVDKRRRTSKKKSNLESVQSTSQAPFVHIPLADQPLDTDNTAGALTSPTHSPTTAAIDAATTGWPYIHKHAHNYSLSKRVSPQSSALLYPAAASFWNVGRHQSPQNHRYVITSEVNHRTMSPLFDHGVLDHNTSDPLAAMEVLSPSTASASTAEVHHRQAYTEARPAESQQPTVPSNTMWMDRELWNMSLGQTSTEQGGQANTGGFPGFSSPMHYFQQPPHHHQAYHSIALQTEPPRYELPYTFQPPSHPPQFSDTAFLDTAYHTEKQAPSCINGESVHDGIGQQHPDTLSTTHSDSYSLLPDEEA